MFFQVSFDLTELGKQLVVLENLEVLDVKVGLVVSLELLLGLAGVNALQDAQTAEVLQGYLEVSNRVRARFVLASFALNSGFYFSSHP